MVSDEDRSWFFTLMAETTEKHFREKFSRVFAGLGAPPPAADGKPAPRGETKPEALKYLMAGDFMQQGGDGGQVSGMELSGTVHDGT